MSGGASLRRPKLVSAPKSCAGLGVGVGSVKIDVKEPSRDSLMSEVPLCLYRHSNPPLFSDEEGSEDEECVIRFKRAAARQKQRARKKANAKKGNPTWVEPIEGLSAGILRETNQEREQDA